MPFRIVPEYLIKDHKYFEKFRPCPPDVAAEAYANSGYTITKADMVRAAGIPDNTFDYALPQQEVNRWEAELGVNIIPHFVWSSETWDIVPITEKGKMLFEIIKHRRQI